MENKLSSCQALAAQSLTPAQADDCLAWLAQAVDSRERSSASAMDNWLMPGDLITQVL